MRTVPAVLALTASLAMAGCGGSSTGITPNTIHSNTPPFTSPASSTGPADPAAATTEVKQLYSTFFAAPTAKAKKLLEGGQNLGKAIKAAAKLKGKMTEKATVNSVTFTSPTTATVSFELNGTGLSGQAVLVDGKWLVAKTTFCTLVSIGTGKPVPGC